MSEQLGLFAAKRPTPPATCPRSPERGLCRDGREGRCPGRQVCEHLGEAETARIRMAEADARVAALARESRRQDEERLGLGAEDLAQDLGVGPPDVGCSQCAREERLMQREAAYQRERDEVFNGPEEHCAAPPLEGLSGAPPYSCGACGSTTGAVFYERGPLAGSRRCWTCARAALEANP